MIPFIPIGPAPDASTPDYPAESDVRDGVDYGDGAYTGTLDVAQGETVYVRQATRDLIPIPVGSGPTDRWAITDVDKEPIDLTDRTIRFVCSAVLDAGDLDDKTDDVLLGVYQYQTGVDDNISIGGADGNEVSVAHDSTKTTTPGVFRYFLWDVTTEGHETVLATGNMPVRPAARAVL